MKRFSKLAIILSVVMALIIPSAAEASSKKTNPHHGSTYKVKGYTKKNGTKVAPYKRTKPNSTKKDNLRIAN
jgi:hypothetical protein